jgi:putative ABC transport system permease protein
MTLREILLRLRAWANRDRLARELEAEMQAHVDLLARDLEHDGMSRSDAIASARRQVGNSTSQRETSRDYWGFPAIDAILQDVRYAVRGLVRSPGFTATVVITLGLGIGANAAMFAVIDRLMFRPFPYLRDPSAVHRVYLQTTFEQRRSSRTVVPYTRYLNVVKDAHTITQHAGVSEWRLAVGRGRDTRVRKVAGVSASLFTFFDAPPALGRYFTASEDVVPLGAMVAVLSHQMWVSEFAERNVLGEQVRVGSLDYTIIGVAPEEFSGTSHGRRPDVWIPITTVAANISPYARNDYWTSFNWDWVEIFVRRAPGMSAENTSAELSSAYRASRTAQRLLNPRVLPDSVAKPAAIAGPLRSPAGPGAGAESRVLLWVSGVAAIVLLIACANVANLMLARVLRRKREIAVRLALGVSRARLTAQFITEGALLAGLGAVAGLLAAQWVGLGIRSLLLPQETTFNLGTDWRTLAFAAMCALVATLLTVIGPAVLATRPDLAASLKAGAREGTFHRSRLRSVLLVTQATLSVVLLVGAALFVRSFSNVLDIPLGYDATAVLEIRSDFRGQTFDSTQQVALGRRLMAAAEAIQGVEAATKVNSRLFGTNTTTLRVPGVDSVERLGRFNFQIATPDYFRVMRTKILRGRPFAEQDRAGSQPVTIVSAAMAKAVWPGQDPLGKCIQPSWTAASGVPTHQCTMVVGVAEDAAQQGITDTQRFMYYINVDQFNAWWNTTILVRMTNGYVAADIERVRQAMQAAMPGDAFVVVTPLQDLVDDQRRSWRLGATLFVGFGVLALLVAAVGLYGVIGYTVAQRMHELGVRIALGARSTDIFRLVVSQGVGFAAAGVAIGLALAALASRWLEPLLYKTSPRDPAAYLGVGVVMAVVAVLASAVPAVRAVRADPNRALRSD